MYLTRRQRRTIRNINFLFYVLSELVIGAVNALIWIGNTMYKTALWMYRYQHYKNIEYSYADIQRLVKSMNGRQFEIFCAELYKCLGHRVILTDAGNDYGRDLILDNNTFVECKHYTGTVPIGREICQKLVGSMEAFQVKNGIIITTGNIHSNAWEYINRIKKTKSLTIVDFSHIMKLVEKIPAEKVPNIMRKATDPSIV